MNVLVACEFSGIVRDAFIARGHNAISCDLEPSEKPGPHLQGDIRNAYWFDWDLVIAHPPCTYLAVSGNRWYAGTQQRDDAAGFAAMFNSWADKVCIENPVSALSSLWRKPDQTIQPWQFGHGEVKRTCLWLKNLPKLEPTNIVEGREQRVWKHPPSPDRQKNRSRFYTGIAEAMAEQWG